MSYAATEDPILAKHSLLRIIETNGEGGNQTYNYTSNINITKTIETQCFPLYSLLMALNQTTVNYFSLDIEGHEKKVLETIPWNKVDIKVLLAAITKGLKIVRLCIIHEHAIINHRCMPIQK